MKALNILHTAMGTVCLVIFFITGQYMESIFPAAYQDNEMIRVLYRANHIYILMSALVNLVLGIYLLQHSFKARKVIQWIASGLILVAPVLFVLAFFLESTAVDLNRPFTFWAVVILFSGVMLNVLAKIGDSWGNTAD